LYAELEWVRAQEETEPDWKDYSALRRKNVHTASTQAAFASRAENRTALKRELLFGMAKARSREPGALIGGS
jgi:hypothetical protein